MSTATTTAHPMEDGALRWFRRLVWAGIVGNIVLGIVSIAYTAQVLELAKVDPATPLVWPRLSAMLIMLLAGFYIPAAIDPCAHRFNAVFAVVCRFAGTIFMTVVGGHYIIFGLFDFIFGAPQAIFLYLAWHRMKAGAEGRASGARIVALLAGLVAAGAFAWGAFHWLMQPILPAFASDEEYFKYGSIGNDGAGGIPYPIWVALPDVCAHHLPRPQGYAALGVAAIPPSTRRSAFRGRRSASSAWRSTAPSAIPCAREWPPMPSRSSTWAAPPIPSMSRVTCVSSRAARQTIASTPMT